MTPERIANIAETHLASLDELLLFPQCAEYFNSSASLDGGSIICKAVIGMHDIIVALT